MNTATPLSTQALVFNADFVNAAADPSLTSFYPTASYRKLLERMKPELPLNIFVYGETGLGKSTAVLAAAKKQDRTVIRINLSKFSDVDDLFGGIRIINGTTYFDKGPVLIAMEIGAILLLDECDSADPQLLTDLHPVLEHRGYFVKKIKKMIFPATGFCVIATANTSGHGDMSGRYIGTNALNAAFLDRFAICLEYAPAKITELKQIIKRTMRSRVSNDMIMALSEWYMQIQKAHTGGVVNESISVRKIVDIANVLGSDNIESMSDKRVHGIIRECLGLMDEHVVMSYLSLLEVICQMPADTMAVDQEPNITL